MRREAIVILVLACRMLAAQVVSFAFNEGAPGTPVDSPSGGGCTGSSGAWTCTGATTITLTDSGALAIYYSTSGTPACPSTGTLYTGPFTSPSSTFTLRAVGCNGLTGGGVLTSVYTITSYTGPGDVTSGAKAWWGLRCYANAYSGDVADVWDSATGSTTETLITCSAGGILNQTVNPLATTCASGCNVKTLYDQSGASFCNSGASACNLTQATNADRPTYTQNCIGSLPCMTFTTSQSLEGATSWELTQTYTGYGAGERTGSTSSYNIITGDSTGDAELGFSNSANTAFIYSGSVATKSSVNDNTFHVLQARFSGSTSILQADSSQTTGLSAGSNNQDNEPCMGKCSSNGLAGNALEAGWWSGDQSANFSTMNSNVHTYWGF